MVLGPPLPEESGDGLFVEEIALGVVPFFFVMNRLFLPKDVQGFLFAMLRAEVVAGLPFAMVAGIEFGSCLIVVALGITPKSSLPTQRLRIDHPRGQGDKLPQTVLGLPDVLFLLLTVEHSLPQVLPGPLGLVPAQLEHTLQRKAEFLSYHPAF